MDGWNTNVLFGSWPIFRERLLLVSGTGMIIMSNNNQYHANILYNLMIKKNYMNQFTGRACLSLSDVVQILISSNLPERLYHSQQDKTVSNNYSVIVKGATTGATVMMYFPK